MTSVISIVPLDQVEVGERYRKDPGDLTGLIASINELGILEPLVVVRKGPSRYLLVCGGRRFACATKLGLKEVPVHVVELANPLQAEFDENAHRKEYTLTERVAIIQAIQATRIGHRPSKDELEKASETDTFPRGSTYSVAEQALGVKKDTLRKEVKLVTAVSENPEKYGPLLEAVMQKKKSVSAAVKQIEADKLAAQVKADVKTDIASSVPSSIDDNSRWKVRFSDLSESEEQAMIAGKLTDTSIPCPRCALLIPVYVNTSDDPTKELLRIRAEAKATEGEAIAK